MFLTIKTSHRPATDLGFLLHKNPARPQSTTLSFGTAHVFYPQATESECQVALLVEVDPVGLVRRRRGPAGEGGLLDQYVNDRPYAASSFLSVALADVFSTALAGRCKNRPDLVDAPLPLEVVIPVVPARGGEELLKNLFEPLDYQVVATKLGLDPRFPEWGEGSYVRLELSGNLPLHRLLSHLYVLLPVLDNNKHYWVGDDEVEKLMRHGEGWLAVHPQKDLITRRYLKHKRSLIDDALSQLTDENDPDPDETLEAQALEEEKVERSISLHEQRLGTVLSVLKSSDYSSILDLGCGEGKLLRLLLQEHQFKRIVGMDVSHRSLEMAMDKLRYDRLPAMQKERLKLLHGSLLYRDERLHGFDAAAVVEVIEHLDPPRLAAFERAVFEYARPRCVVITTPNSEYNVKWETLTAGQFRHRDHRFEWNRTQFSEWGDRIGAQFGFQVRYLPVGPVDPLLGAPTQMGIFTRRDS